MQVKIVLHGPRGTARLTYDDEGKLIEGDKEHALEIGKEATQMEVVCGEHYSILTDKSVCIAGDEKALHEALADFPDDDIAALFKAMMEKPVEPEPKEDDADDDLGDVDDLLDKVESE